MYGFVRFGSASSLYPKRDDYETEEEYENAVDYYEDYLEAVADERRDERD